MLDMTQELIFPAVSNFSRIPPDFRCCDICIQPGTSIFQQMHVNSMYLVDSPAGWSISRTEDFNEPEHIDLFFITSGTICYQSASGKGRAGAGQVMIIPSWINRIIWLDEASSHIYCRIDWNSRDYSAEKILVRNSAAIDDMSAFVRSLIFQNSPAVSNPVYQRNLLENITILVHQELFPGNRMVSSEMAMKLQDYMQKENPAKLKVHNIARKFSMSLSSFRQFCLKNFHQSPNELINGIRMSQARALLLYSDLTIDAIASQLGYSSRFAFSKAFRRINHISPGAFRRK